MPPNIFGTFTFTLKTHKIEKKRMAFRPNGSDKIKEEAEKYVNLKAAVGCEIISVSFDTNTNGYIYCFITYCE